MRRATLALALGLLVGSFATVSNAAPTEGQPPAAAAPVAAPPAVTPTPSTTKPARLTAHQRALRACAKMKDEAAKGDCQRRAQTQAKAAPRKTTTAKRKPAPTAPAAAAVSTN